MRENNSTNPAEKDILYSRTIKAGKRIYYIDVKRNSRKEMYLAITESKKTVSGDVEMPQFNYERHKVFIYPEDFNKFSESLASVMNYISENQGETPQRPEETQNDIKLDDLEF